MAFGPIALRWLGFTIFINAAALGRKWLIFLANTAIWCHHK